MISMRADAEHGPLSRSRGPTSTADTAQGADFRGTEDWIFRAVGTDRDVLLIGPDAIRFAGGLSDRRCRVAMAGCESAPAVAGNLDELDLAREIGDRQFDVVLATELLDCVSQPVALLDEVRKWLSPGGCVVATQSEPSGRINDVAARRRPAGRGSLLSLFEGSGFAVTRYQQVSLPDLDPSTAEGTPGACPPLPFGPWVDRSLLVALPVEGLDREWRHPIHRALVEDRNNAARQASDLTRELRSTSARVNSLTDHLTRSLRREEELRGLLRLAQERFEQDDQELRSLAQKFQEDLRRLQEDIQHRQNHLWKIQDDLRIQVERGDALEARLIRFRRSLPGRLFLTLRAISSIGRR
jgi:Methyltransferase domain